MLSQLSSNSAPTTPVKKKNFEPSNAFSAPRKLKASEKFSEKENQENQIGFHSPTRGLNARKCFRADPEFKPVALVFPEEESVKDEPFPPAILKPSKEGIHSDMVNFSLEALIKENPDFVEVENEERILDLGQILFRFFEVKDIQSYHNVTAFCEDFPNYNETYESRDLLNFQNLYEFLKAQKEILNRYDVLNLGCVMVVHPFVIQNIEGVMNNNALRPVAISTLKELHEMVQSALGNKKIDILY